MKAVIFDLDGTLVNTISGITHFINRATASLGLSSLSSARVQSYVGNGAPNLMHKTLAHLGAEELFEEVFPFFWELYRQYPCHASQPYDGVVDTLKALRAAGIKTAVFSNKPHEATLPTCEQFFAGQLDYVLGHKEGMPHKPEIAGALEVCTALRVTPQECLYVGDSEVDMLTGKKAGMLTVGVNWGFREESVLWENGADHVINKPEELLCLLK